MQNRILFPWRTWSEIYARKKPREILARPVKSSGAGGRTRTGTWLPTADFESAASANSATPADDMCHQRSLL